MARFTHFSCGVRERMKNKINVCRSFAFAASCSFLILFFGGLSFVAFAIHVCVYADDIVWSSVCFSFIFLMERAVST